MATSIVPPFPANVSYATDLFGSKEKSENASEVVVVGLGNAPGT